MSTATPRDASTDQLDPLPVEEAAEMYVRSRAGELADRTLELYRGQLDRFAEWCDAEGPDDTSGITARALRRYHLSFPEGTSQTTLALELSAVRRFAAFCEELGAAPEGEAGRFTSPSTGRETRDEMLGAEEAADALRRLPQGGLLRALLLLVWRTGMRTGAVQGLDLRDLDAEAGLLRVRHRPGEGTPLKNGEDGERSVALADATVAELGAYVAGERVDAVDDHGRRPLFTTRDGRPRKNTLRRYLYAATRPCQAGGGCPHGRDPDDCEAAGWKSRAFRCPSSVSGHPVRRGAITHHLRQGVPERVVSGRMDVSLEVLDEHYDRRTDDEKAERRRAFLDNV